MKDVLIFCSALFPIHILSTVTRKGGKERGKERKKLFKVKTLLLFVSDVFILFGKLWLASIFSLVCSLTENILIHMH